MNENWCEIVDILKDAIDNNYSKQNFTNAVENCLRILGWRKTNGSLITEYKLSNNSTIDIVLSKLCDENRHFNFLPVFIEEKGNLPTLSTVNFAMKELETNVALCLGKYINLLYYNTENIICKTEIPLDQTDKDGIEISELLTAKNFDKLLLQKYITSLLERNNTTLKLRQDIEQIASSERKLRSIFSDYLIQQGYDSKLVEQEITNFRISVSMRPSYTTRNIYSQNKKDTTRYSFNGSPFYPKKKFVLAIIKQYVNDHPNITYDELEKTFPSRIISRKRGIIRPLSMVQEWIARNPDLKSRFFLEPEELITLKDGIKYTIYNQWGLGPFDKFLQIVPSMYIVKSDKDNNSEQAIDSLHESGIKISEKSLLSFTKKKN